MSHSDIAARTAPGTVTGGHCISGSWGRTRGHEPTGAQEKVAASLIAGVLRGLHFTVGKEDLGREARRRCAPGALIELLARMPDRQYPSADNVAQGGWKGRRARAVHRDGTAAVENMHRRNSVAPNHPAPLAAILAHPVLAKTGRPRRRGSGAASL